MTKSLQLLRAICKRLEIEGVESDTELMEMADATSVDMLAQRVQTELPKCD